MDPFMCVPGSPGRRSRSSRLVAHPRPTPLATGVASLVILFGPAEGVAGQLDEGYTRTDSAGVAIIENHAPRWAEGEAWTVHPEPTLEIGVLDGPAEYLLHDVAGVTRLSDGRVVVFNGGDAQLRFYDSSGRFIDAFAGEGDGPGELRRPEGLDRQSGDTLLVASVADWVRSRFTSDGEFVDQARLDAEALGAAIDSLWGCPTRPGLLPDGSILICAGTGAPRATAEGFTRVSHWLVRTSYDVSRLDTLGTFHGFVPSMRMGPPPTEVAAGGDPLRIFVGDPAHFEIDRFGPDGRRVASIRYPDGRVPVSASDGRRYDQIIAERRASLPPGPPAPPPSETRHATSLPGFVDLTYDDAGFLWATRYSLPWAETRAALVFTEDGRLLGEVALPAGFEIHEIGRDHVLGVWRDEFDVEYVRMHRLERGAR